MVTFPKNCPACQTLIEVTECTCPACKTTIKGQFALPTLLRLSVEDQLFIYNFLLCSGSLKDMANQMGVSYPTMRNKLDELIYKLKNEK